ncbi:MFS transporter [Streptomyces beijiangensis]|uniref:MFS transporter n=1 Tax=Streptomyces beijiangensis TaxID=163361 RepID=A0A939F9J1_9ACTN|nr:MFS transporter [Streptomyces beijiangensis]MBO0514104.1 MFS transporter [Streptomyces beijiangensis]
MSYAAVLRIPHARRTFAAALFGRLSYGMVSLSIVLAVKDATGSYAVAGTVMALFGITSVFLSPARAALIDRYGPRRALVPMAAVYAALLLLLAYAAQQSGASGVLLGVLAVSAGACTPPLGPTMRALWGQLLSSDRRLLQRAYSLDGVAEELLFVTGPLLVGLVVKFASPALGVAVSAVLVLGGTLALVSSPAARSYPVRKESDPVVRAAVPWHPVLVVAGLGVALGALDLLVVAFADGHGRPEAVAWVLAALSAGSAVGGLVGGAVEWRIPAGRRLSMMAAGLGLAVAAAGFAPNLWVLGAAAVVAGLFVAPALTTGYLIADETAAPGTRTQAGAWVNTAVNAGMSGGSAAVGVLIGRLPLTLCFALAAAPALLAALQRLRLRLPLAAEMVGDRSE